jgi:hypothetical protein
MPIAACGTSELSNKGSKGRGSITIPRPNVRPHVEKHQVTRNTFAFRMLYLS